MIKDHISPQLIIHNAKLYDPVQGFLNASALAIRDNRIFCIGGEKEIMSLTGNRSKVFDVRKSIVLPALTDAHIHFINYIRRKRELRLENCSSLSEALKNISHKVDQTPEGQWITGGGWNRNLWPAGQYPDRHQLDRISTKHFIALDSKDWHTTWVNTPVLELAGIPLDEPYQDARHLAVHPVTRKFTGVLEEDIRLKVLHLIPSLEFKSLRETYRKGLQEFYGFGYASIHSVEMPAEFGLLQQARACGELGLRVAWYMPANYIPEIRRLHIRQGLGDEFLRIAGVKIFVDGSFGSQTAELMENYVGLDHAGVEVMPEQELTELVGQAVEAGMSCAVHAIGDRAVAKTLKVFGRFTQSSKLNGLKHRIEHVQLIQPEHMKLFQKYGIYASVQPLHLAWDIPIIDKYLGGRQQYSYAFGSLHREKADLLFGSDAPVESINPWQAIYSAMTRKYALDHQQKSFYPQECLDLKTCIQAYTVNPARAVGMDRISGRLKTGVLADLMVLNHDVFSIDAVALKETHSVLTILDGRLVHQQTDF